jgi:hypothetical protein
MQFCIALVESFPIERMKYSAAVEYRGVGNLRFIGLVGLGPASTVEFSPSETF